MHRRILVSLLLLSESSRGFLFPEPRVQGRHHHHSSIILSNSYWGDQEFDFDGFSERLRYAYEDWCQTYGENKLSSSSRMEVFSYHFMVAENYSRRTGVKVKLNQFAGLTQPEIENVMVMMVGETSDNIERPLGAEFLDYALQEGEEESRSTVLTSTEPPPTGSGDQVDPPLPQDRNGFGSNAGDKVAIATNAYLEQMDMDSIVPPTDENLFQEINNESSMSLVDDEVVVKEEEEEPLGQALASDPVNEDQSEVTSSNDIDEGALSFLSHLERFSKEQAGLDNNNNMDGSPPPDKEDTDDTISRSKRKSRLNTDGEKTPIQDAVVSETVSDPSFNPEEAYFFAGQQESVDPDLDQEQVQPPTEPPPATPMAREAAKRANIDLSLIQGTGKDGRITLHDVEVARDGMLQEEGSPTTKDDVWESSYSSKEEERIQNNGPFRPTSHADAPPSDHGATDSLDPPPTTTDYYGEAELEFQQHASGDDDSLQEMFRRQAEAFLEDETPTPTQYDIIQDGTQAPSEQRYQVGIDVDDENNNPYPRSEDEEFGQELGDSTLNGHSNPDMTNGFHGPAESREESTIEDATLDHLFDQSLDEEIERAINGDLESVSQEQQEEAVQHLEEPKGTHPPTDFPLSVEEEQLTSITDQSSDGPIASHDDTTKVDEHPIGQKASLDEVAKDLKNEDEELLETEPPMSRRVERAPSEDHSMEGDSQENSLAHEGDEEEISTDWVEEEEDPEDEHFDLPDWVVGNADPLVPPHLSGAERVTGEYKIEDVMTAPKFEDNKVPPVSTGLSRKDTSQQRDEKPVSIEKPPKRRARRVSSAKQPVQSPTFLDAVTSERVEGDQVQLPELTFWMSEAKIQKWCKKVGDPVHVGETLMVVVCDTKISKETLEWAPTQDVKATSNGFLVAKHFGAADMISKGWTVGVIGTSTEGLVTVDPEPIITYVYDDDDNDGASEDDLIPKKKPKNLNRPEKKKKMRNKPISAKKEKSKLKKKKASVKKSRASRHQDDEQVPTRRQIQKQKVQEATKKPGWKLSPLVDWEPKRVKTDGMNHVLIPFLQTKIDAWVRKSKFRLPPTNSLEQEVLTSRKNKMTIRWEPRRDGKEKKNLRKERPKQLQSQHCFASLPAVSWQFEKSQLPSESNQSKKEKRTRQIIFLEPKAGLSRKGPRRQRLGGKTRWDSFPTLIKWENATHPLPPRRSPVPETSAVNDEHHGLALPQKLIYATPMARAAARMAKLDLQHVSGSGVGGRITLDDVKDVLYPMLLKEQHQRKKQQELLQGEGEEEVHEEFGQTSKSSIATPPPASLQDSRQNSRPIRIHSLRVPYASPLARKLAEEHEIDLGSVKGSGPRGRILLEDVQTIVLYRMNDTSRQP